MMQITRRLCSSLAIGSMAPASTVRPATVANGMGVDSKVLARRPTLRGVVFDMDGTLTMPNLDFGAMYERCGVPRSDDILAAIAKMPPSEAAPKSAIIEEMEEEGRRTLRLMPGAIELGVWLKCHNVPISLVTRNTRRTVQALVDEHWLPSGGARFEHSLSRDDCDGLPPKPHPAMLEEIARRWSIELPSRDILMVGDSPTHDVGFGRAAGVSTALLDTEGRNAETAGYQSSGGDCQRGDGGADLRVVELWQLAGLVWRTFEIDGPLGTGAPLLKYSQPKPSGKASIAAFEGNLGALKRLSTEELCTVDESGNTPLIWATEGGHFDIVRELLKVPGIDVNGRGYLGATAVCRASRMGNAHLLRLLAEEGKADLDIPNSKMQYPLHFAAFKKQSEAVDALLELGANSLVLDRKGRTPAEDTSDEKIRGQILSARKKLHGLVHP